MDATGPLRRCGRLAIAALRCTWHSFAAYGMAVTGVQPSPQGPAFPTGAAGQSGGARLASGHPGAAAGYSERPSVAPPDWLLDGPPAGHPERLIPDVPLDPVESGLWRQLR
ncbi:DUF6059 family protein [Actinoplanes sp. NPDC051346]|uniref:DUF6059 family protein n=1 Tax=Actinoplanes sp. NPDC051346 TaxID=3155048 RepID=UPI0034368DF2